ncbi:MAG: hypothetical protein K0R14_679 [Burkholderiales bacterium]|jgi:hypothetical protein|nr:hypothetical protein [Burkholderiales bacterium]
MCRKNASFSTRYFYMSNFWCFFDMRALATPNVKKNRLFLTFACSYANIFDYFYICSNYIINLLLVLIIMVIIMLLLILKNREKVK